MAAELLPAAANGPSRRAGRRPLSDSNSSPPAPTARSPPVACSFASAGNRADRKPASNYRSPPRTARSIPRPSCSTASRFVPAWNASANGALLTLPQPGSHELTAVLTPLAGASPAGNAQRARLQLHIPPLAGATVEVLHPAGLPDVRVASAVPVASQSNAARSTFRLGPTPLLDVTWPARLEREAAGVAVEQLSLARTSIPPAPGSKFASASRAKRRDRRPAPRRRRRNSSFSPSPKVRRSKRRPAG